MEYVDKLKNCEKDLNHDGRSEIIGKKLKDACDKNQKNFFICPYSIKVPVLTCCLVASQTMMQIKASLS